MGGPADDSATPVEVVLFERDRDFDAIFDAARFQGRFFSQLDADVELQPLIVVRGGLSYEARATLQHELVHQILRRRTGNLPLWLDEGLSEVYSTLRVEAEGVAIVGEPPLDADFWNVGYSEWRYFPRSYKLFFPHEWAPDLDNLLRADRLSIEGEAGIYYAASWKLLHTLRGHRDGSYAPRFSAMMKDLMAGTDGDVAFARAYKGVLMSEIEKKYQEMLLDAREYPRTVRFQAPKQETPVSRRMADAEIHAVWARLLVEESAQSLSAEDDLSRGLDESRWAPSLLYARAAIRLQKGDTTGVQEDIDQLLQAEPENPRYLLLALKMAAPKLDLSTELKVSYGIQQDRQSTPDASAARARVSRLTEQLMRVAVSPMQRTLAAIYAGCARPHRRGVRPVGERREARPVVSALLPGSRAHGDPEQEAPGGKDSDPEGHRPLAPWRIVGELEGATHCHRHARRSADQRATTQRSNLPESLNERVPSAITNWQ